MNFAVMEKKNKKTLIYKSEKGKMPQRSLSFFFFFLKLVKEKGEVCGPG